MSKKLTIVFQGDSITDAERNRDDKYDLGNGYVKIVAESLTEKYPDIEFEFFNRGVWAEESKDLLVRWDDDCISLNPDIVCVLVGINDAWHCYNRDYIITDTMYKEYCEKLFRAVKGIPAKLIIMEPYLLDNPEMPFRERLNPDIDRLRELAKVYADEYIPLDGLMAAEVIHSDIYSLTDEGVHPTALGAQKIAGWLCDAVEKVINQNE